MGFRSMVLAVLLGMLILFSGCTDALLVVGEMFSSPPPQCHIEVIKDEGPRKQIRLVFDGGQANTSAFEVQGQLNVLTGLECMSLNMLDLESNRAYTTSGDDAVIVGDAQINVYRMDGSLKSISIYRNGLPNGVWLSWYRDGSLYNEQVYVDGLMGDTKVWHENGQMSLLRLRKAGSDLYEEQRWDDQGRLIGEERTYIENGREMRLIKLWDESGELLQYYVRDMGPYLSGV